MVKTIKIPRDVIQNGRRIVKAFRFVETMIFSLPVQSFFTEREESLQLLRCAFVKNEAILQRGEGREQKIVSREKQKIIRFGAEKSGVQADR